MNIFFEKIYIPCIWNHSFVCYYENDCDEKDRLAYHQESI